MLSKEPSLAGARDEKGSAVSSALAARQGVGFMPRRDNRVLAAILKKRPQLTPSEVCSVGTASQVRAQLTEDPAFVKSRLTPSSDAAKVLIAHGADVNARQAEGVTALQEAASNGDTVSIRLLLAAGADPSSAMPDGRTALDFALAGNHSEAARLLKP